MLHEIDDKHDHFTHVVNKQGHGMIPKNFKVKFLNDKAVPSRLYPASTAELKPAGSKTYDEDWRLTLKVGDEIDAWSTTQNKWVLSTVAKAEERVKYD